MLVPAALAAIAPWGWVPPLYKRGSVAPPLTTLPHVLVVFDARLIRALGDLGEPCERVSIFHMHAVVHAPPSEMETSLCPTARVLTGAGLRPALRIVKDKHTSSICAVVCPQSARVEVAMVVNS